MIKLEDIYEFGNELPIVIMDCRVLLFNILARYGYVAERLVLDPVLKKEWFMAQWASIINRPLPWLANKPEKGWNIIVVDDYKGEDGTYWRNKVVVEAGLPRYKGNRNYDDRPDTYFSILETVHSYLAGATIPLFRQRGFEADDFAGLAARLKPRDSQPMFLYTVDTDWSQLVNDAKGIMFASTRNYAPRLRSEYEVLKWATKKGWALSSPSQVVDIKVKYGDEADNLAPGSPKGVICLEYPMQVPSKANTALLKKALGAKYSNNNAAHAEAAYRWLLRNDFA